jgi:anti-anti-sigma factor
MTTEQPFRRPPWLIDHPGRVEQVRQPFSDGVAASVADADGETVVTVSSRVERESSDAGPDDALTVIAIDGEIDQDTAPLVRLALEQALHGRTSVCCDVSRVSFFGVAAAHTVLDAHSHAVETGCVFFLRGVRGTAARVLNAVDPCHRVPR